MQFGVAFALVGLTVCGLTGTAALGQAVPAKDQVVPRPASLAPAVKDSPFSAERHKVRNRTLDDGTLITETWPRRKIYRDGQGRTRVERPLLGFPNAPEFPRVVELTDSSAGVEYVLDPQRKLAHRFRSIPAVAATADTTPAENLGTWIIAGFRAEGQRRSGTLPFSPHAVVTETWFAPELQAVVRQKVTDPRFGESVEELTNIRTGEQDPTLFQVPTDYSVVDEAADFEISFHARPPASLPTVIRQMPAAYTDEAKRRGIQGVVRLTLFVDETGKAQGIRVENSLDPGLDKEAIKAVRGWLFQPGQQDGHAVRVPVHVEISFSLDN